MISIPRRFWFSITTPSFSATYPVMNVVGQQDETASQPKTLPTDPLGPRG